MASSTLDQQQLVESALVVRPSSPKDSRALPPSANSWRACIVRRARHLGRGDEADSSAVTRSRSLLSPSRAELGRQTRRAAAAAGHLGRRRGDHADRQPCASLVRPRAPHGPGGGPATLDNVIADRRIRRARASADTESAACRRARTGLAFVINECGGGRLDRPGHARELAVARGDVRGCVESTVTMPDDLELARECSTTLPSVGSS